MKTMINRKLLFFKSRNYFSLFIIILLAIFIACLVLSGKKRVSFGFLVFVSIILYFKKVEDLFLFWLLLFSLFATDVMVVLVIEKHPIITFDRVFIAILSIIFLKEIILEQRKLFPLSGVDISFILFLLICSFSIIVKTENKLMAARVLTDAFFMPYLIFFLSKHFISNKRDFNKFVNIILTIGIYISIMGIIERFSGYDILAVGRGKGQTSGFLESAYGLIDSGSWLRVNGPYPYAPSFGIIASICFFIILYKYIVHKKSNKFLNKFYILSLGINALAVYFCLYRGIWLAFFLGIFLGMIIRRKGIIKLSAVLIMLIIIAFSFSSEIKSTRFYSERLAEKGTLESRFRKYDRAFSVIKENPIFGVGFRNYFDYTETETSQHNQILALLSEIGIIGTIIYVSLIWSLIYYGIKNYKLSIDYFEKQFAIVYLSILVVYIVSFTGLDSGFLDSVNLLFFAISGVALSPSKWNERGTVE